MREVSCRWTGGSPEVGLNSSLQRTKEGGSIVLGEGWCGGSARTGGYSGGEGGTKDEEGSAQEARVRCGNVYPITFPHALSRHPHPPVLSLRWGCLPTL
jgi:hypothetical protein